MKLKQLLLILFILLPSVLFATEKKASYSDLNKVYSEEGRFIAPSGECVAEQSVSSVGGFKILLVKSRDGELILAGKDDASGLAWISGNTLVYSISPIYGKAGIYKFDCKTKELTQLVKPKTTDKGYPDGADYFELHSIENQQGTTVLFYYSPDVDKTDFNNFRNIHNVYKVKLDGSQFTKAYKSRNP